MGVKLRVGSEVLQVEGGKYLVGLMVPYWHACTRPGEHVQLNQPQGNDLPCLEVASHPLYLRQAAFSSHPESTL